MATIYWLGGAADHENDWNTGSNWSGGSVPVTGDTVVFDGRSSYDATENMDQTGVDAANIHIMNSYQGSIGAVDAPLIIECSGTVLIEGSGSYYIQCGNDAADADIASMIINTTGTVGLSSQKNAAAGNIAQFTLVKIVKGTLYVYGDADKSETGAEDGTYIGTLWIVPTSNRGGNVNVVIGDQCEDFKNSLTTTIYMSEGTVSCYSDLDALYMFGGVFYHGGTAYNMDADDDNIGTIYQVSGTFHWHPSAVSAGTRTKASPSPTITSAYVFGGTFNASEMLEADIGGTQPTITNMSMFPNSVVKLNNGFESGAGIAVTNSIKFYGGKLELPVKGNITVV